VEEAYATGRWNRHLSDDMDAFALAHNAADRQAPPAADEGCRRRRKCRGRSESSPTARGESVLLAVGEVRVVEEGSNP
jgi:hypothetical protein